MEKEEVIETVDVHCKHKDCVYRTRLSLSGDCCGYMLYTDMPRGCKISECDKYRKGRKIPTTKGDLYTWTVEEDDKL